MDPLSPNDPRQVGRYRLGGRLGAGGMGEVYWGLSPGGRAVAVKVVRRELGHNPEFRRRFAQELEAARRVGGFHTAPVVDADPDGDPPWMVTAYVPGPALSTVLHAHGALPERSLRVLGAGLAEALEAIHRAGVIHRDLKPANILMAQDGPRVIDFGIARALEATAHTSPSAVIGTPGFMAPEQVNGEPITPATDMFALGLVLCHAAGGRPYGEGNPAAMLHRVVSRQPDLSGLPPGLREVAGRCLDRIPALRPAPGEVLHLLGDSTPVQDWLPVSVSGMLPRHALPESPPTPLPAPASSPVPMLERAPAFTPAPASAAAPEVTVRLRAADRYVKIMIMDLLVALVLMFLIAPHAGFWVAAAVFVALLVNLAVLLFALFRLVTSPYRLRVDSEGLAIVRVIRSIRFPWADVARVEWAPYLPGHRGGALIAHPMPNSRLPTSGPTRSRWDANRQIFIVAIGAELTRPVVDVMSVVEAYGRVPGQGGWNTGPGTAPW